MSDEVSFHLYSFSLRARTYFQPFSSSSCVTVQYCVIKKAKDF